MTKESKKQKAGDYLREYAQQSESKWLKKLISEIVILRETPDETFLSALYEDFLIEEGLKKATKQEIGEELTTSSKTTPISSDFSLESLKHLDGVNALSEGEAISFHKRLTVVYGKNGSGKSSTLR